MNCFKLIPALLLLTLPACILDKDLGDTPGTTTTGEPPAETGDTGDTSVSDPTVTTGEPGQLCPGSEDFTCTVAYDCKGFSCGGLDDVFNADGCTRNHCNADQPCAAGEVCYDTGAWGTCNASSTFCEDMDDMCICGQTTDCNDISYCVPAEIGPPADCFAITDADACLAAGCSEASTVLTVVDTGDTCNCEPSEIACLWFPAGDKSNNGTPTTYYEIASDRVVVFPGEWTVPPKGWKRCGEGESPAACMCADTCEG